MGDATPKQAAGLDAYCPHCHLLVEERVRDGWPATGVRCRHCRLLIGPGRARATPEADPGARGSAAGVFAQQAKLDPGGGDATPAEVRKAIRSVAKELGSRPERLLMVDYQQHVSDGTSFPSLHDVFAAYGSWKRARREAAAA